ncbi:MAG: DUF1194 domain-containing protein [Pseudomonadota bacterium]
MLLISSIASVLAQAQQPVSLELVLLVDVSASVEEDEFRLQREGLAAAFASADVRRAIRQNARGGTAVAVVQWGDHKHQHKAIDWVVLRSDEDALAVASRIAEMPRLIEGGHTAIGDALIYGLKELDSNSFEGLRRAIDLSGDGRSNDGRSLSESRQTVLSAGVTINALAILNEIPLLHQYFRKHLIGGDAAFMLTASDYRDFARAIRLKLEQEIRSAPLSNLHPSSGFRFAGARPGVTDMRR